MNIENLLSEEIKRILKEYYWIKNFSSVRLLWDNENLVFSIDEKVFRVTSWNHRSKKEIFEEMKLLQILLKEWCDVVRIILSNAWNVFEGNDDVWFIVCFEYAQGKIIDIEKHKEYKKIIQERWRTMWKIHYIIAKYHDKLNYENRLQFNQEPQ